MNFLLLIFKNLKITTREIKNKNIIQESLKKFKIFYFIYILKKSRFFYFITYFFNLPKINKIRKVGEYVDYFFLNKR